MHETGVTTVQVSNTRWSVIKDGLPIGAIGPRSHPSGRGPMRTVWVVISAGRGVDIDAVRDVPYLLPAGAVEAVLDAREAHDRAREIPGLDPNDRRLLDFERAYWGVPGAARVRQACRVFQYDEEHYHAAVRVLVESTNPALREYAPDVLDRLARRLARQPRHRAPRSA